MAGFSLGFAFKGFGQGSDRLRRLSRKSRDRQVVAVRLAALLAEREIKLGLRRGSPGGKKFKPLSKLTKLLTGRSKPLKRSGSLLGSVSTTHNELKNEAFVGVHRTAKGPNGEGLVNVAVAHEFGAKPFTIPVTDAMRSFFWAMSIKTGGKIKPLSPNKRFIQHPGVPARPFIRPVIEKIRPQLQQIILKPFQRGL